MNPDNCQQLVTFLPQTKWATLQDKNLYQNM